MYLEGKTSTKLDLRGRKHSFESHKWRSQGALAASMAQLRRVSATAGAVRAGGRLTSPEHLFASRKVPFLRQKKGPAAALLFCPTRRLSQLSGDLYQ
jgi:hypothetical protein